MRRWVTLSVVALLVAGTAPLGAAAGVTDAPRTGDGAAVVDRPVAGPGGVLADHAERDYPTTPVTLTVSQDPTANDALEVTVTVADTSGLEKVWVSTFDDTTVTGTDGFSHEGDGDYVWDAETDTPTLTYRWDTSESVVDTYVDEDTVIAQVNEPTVTALREGVGILSESIYHYEVEGTGTTADEVVVVGNYTAYERQAQDERIRLVVPGVTDPEWSPNATVRMLDNASKGLDPESGSDVVHGVATPDRTGYQSSGAFYLSEDARKQEVLGAYVETQRDFGFQDQGNGSRIYDAFPVYYGVQIAAKTGYADEATFEARLSSGGEFAMLAWTDRQIRLATDGERSLQDVFARLNHHRSVNRQNFRSTVVSVGNASIAETALAYLSDAESPPTEWPDGAYERAYGYRPADPTTGSPGVATRGPVGNRTLSGDGDPVVGVTETLVVRTPVRNDGGVAGRVVVDGGLESPHGTDLSDWTEAVWVEPGENRTVVATHEFDRPGNYTVNAGDSDVDVRVVPVESTASVESVEAPANVTVSETIAVDATVRNDAATLSQTRVPFLVNGTRVAERTVLLGPGESRTLSFAVGTNESGVRRVAVGSASATVEVRSDGPLAAFGPGFGPATVAVALVAVGLLFARRRAGRP